MAGNTTVQITSEETGPNAPAPEVVDYSNEEGRPEWLPSNFKDVESYVSSAEETKAALTRTQQELASRTGAETEGGEAGELPEGESTKPEVTDTSAIDAAAQKAADKAGVDLTPYQEEYFTTGNVTEDNRAKLADSLKDVFGDQSRAVIDQFIDTKKVTHTNDMALYMDTAGGEEQYGEMVQWAAANQDPSFVAQYNEQVNSPDRNTVLFAIENLKQRYEATNGKAPKLLKGNAPKTGATGFRSTAEMTKAMANPQYKTDPAYRDDVAKRIAASNFGE